MPDKFEDITPEDIVNEELTDISDIVCDLDERLSSVEELVNDHCSIVDEIDADIENLAFDVNELKITLQKLNERITALESE